MLGRTVKAVVAGVVALVGLAVMPQPGSATEAAGAWHPPATIAANALFVEGGSASPAAPARSTTLTQANALFAEHQTYGARGTLLDWDIDGDTSWDVELRAEREGLITEGVWDGVPTSRDPGDRFSLQVGADGSCTGTSWLAIDDVAIDSEGVRSIALRFGLTCGGATGVLHGALTWDRDVVQGGPLNPRRPVPAGLWAPPPGALPTSDSAGYLVAATDDPVAHGARTSSSTADALFGAEVTERGLAFGVAGEDHWGGYLDLPHGADRITTGLYDDLGPANPLRGQFRVSFESTTCNHGFGWVAIDSIAYDGDELTSVALRLEQRCEPGGPALRAAFRWDRDARIPPAPNPRPVPADLWRPSEGTTPTARSFLLVRGTIPPATEPQSVVRTDGELREQNDDRSSVVLISPDWDALELIAPLGDDLRPGLYAGLRSNLNPREGTVGISVDHQGCGHLDGWFAIDRISWQGAVLEDLAVRASATCNDGTSPGVRAAAQWEPAPPAGSPSAPTAVRVGRTDGRASVSWSPPTTTGSGPVSGYRVTAYVDGEARPAITLPAGARSYVAPADLAGTTATFRVQAVNGAGRSAASAETRALTIGASADERLVIRTYRDLLGRRPDAPGLRHWTQALATGTTPAAMVRSLAATSEHRATIVRAAFLTALDALPTAAQRTRWVDHLAAGGTVTDLEIALATSHAMATRTPGLAPEPWGMAVLALAGNRLPAPREANQFVDTADSPAFRLTFATTQMRSELHLRVLIDRTFRSTLGRGADEGAIRFWTAQIRRGRPVEAVRAHLLASDEYLRRATA